MGLTYSILQNKPKKHKNNEEYIDLLAKTFNDKDIKLGTFLLTQKEYIGRPDLVSLAYYGTDQYADIICKLNGIQNPFELNENQWIRVPSVDEIHQYTSMLDNEDWGNNDVNDDQFININATPFQKLKNEERLVGEQIIGDVNKIVDKTNMIVIY